jgi:hypothetical protein
MHYDTVSPDRRRGGGIHRAVGVRAITPIILLKRNMTAHTFWRRANNFHQIGRLFSTMNLQDFGSVEPDLNQ